MKKYAVIVAGGKGLRMGADLPKQFLLLHNLPVLMHTLYAFQYDPSIQIILVLPESQFDFWKSLCISYDFKVPHHLCKGGLTRFESVKNGLSQIGDIESLVAIHDGVRPLVSPQLINAAWETTVKKGSAVAVVRLKDSIRKQELTGETRNVNRENFFLVQTPQTFSSKLIIEAYSKATHDNFTDDASVYEEAGGKVFLSEGSYRNIKITTPEDLIIAEALMKSGN